MYKDALKEVQSKMQQWDEMLQTVEAVVDMMLLL